MENPLKGKTGIKRIWNAFGYSLQGLGAAFRHESAFRQELALCIILVPVALRCGCTGLGKALLLGSLLLVLIVELLNSAIEAVVDRASPDYHDLAKRAKDMGSAAVLLSLINLVVVWFLVLYDS